MFYSMFHLFNLSWLFSVRAVWAILAVRSSVRALQSKLVVRDFFKILLFALLTVIFHLGEIKLQINVWQSIKLTFIEFRGVI